MIKTSNRGDVTTDTDIRVLSGVKIIDMDSLKEAIQVLHRQYRIPHVIITSVSLPAPDLPPRHLSVVGSTMTSDFRPRVFKIIFPAIDCYFSGTGDMFAALTTARMRQAVWEEAADLRTRRSWLSDDDVDVLSLPLVRAAEKVVGSMHEVLTKTAEGMAAAAAGKAEGTTGLVDGGEGSEKKAHLLGRRNAELRLVRNLASLRDPQAKFRAKAI